jgi:hypothetical protein
MAILARIRAIWRHLPPGGRLLFFDVKPVTVKLTGVAAHAARRLVLGRPQKTRGRFYLFLGTIRQRQVHRAFLAGKDRPTSTAMSVRRWYPEGIWWP